jgi:hypothetical protein
MTTWYGVLTDSTQYQLVMMKATSAPATDGSWSNVDGSILVSQEDVNRDDNHAGIIKSIWTFEDGDDLHVATQQTGGRVAYHKFDKATETWTTRDEFVDDAGILSSGTRYEPTYPACSIAVRSNGEKVVGYGACRALSPTFLAIACRLYKAGAWGGRIDVAEAASTSYTGVVIVLGASSRRHFFFKDDTNDDAYQRCLRSNDVFETMPSAFDTAVNTNPSFLFGNGFLNGTTVKCPYGDTVGGNFASYAEFTSADTPTVSINSAVTDQGGYWPGGDYLVTTALDGTDEYLIYGSSDGDIWLDKNDTTDTEKQPNVSCTRLSANVYADGAGATYLCYFWLDSTTEKYSEQAITPSVSTLSAAALSDQNYNHGPFKT